MEFGWTSEQEMWRRAVHDFAQSEIAPRVREMDSCGKIPAPIVDGMARMGLLALTVPEEYGGMGADWTMACIAAEELARADISLALPETASVKLKVASLTRISSSFKLASSVPSLSSDNVVLEPSH